MNNFINQFIIAVQSTQLRFTPKEIAEFWWLFKNDYQEFDGLMRWLKQSVDARTK